MNFYTYVCTYMHTIHNPNYSLPTQYKKIHTKILIFFSFFFLANICIYTDQFTNNKTENIYNVLLYYN